MSDEPIEALITDLLIWLGPHERPYDEVMAAWRTSCPRLPVWEEVSERGLIARSHNGVKSLVTITTLGRAYLEAKA